MERADWLTAERGAVANMMYSEHSIADERDDRPEAERLVMRLADGEAAADERARFETLAAAEPTLWRRLAEAHEANAALERDVEQALTAAMQVDLPNTASAATAARRTHRGPWIAAAVGWAAVLVLAVVWIGTDRRTPGPTDGMTTPVELPPIEDVLSFDEAYEYYLSAPWVRGEMQPHLIETQQQPDGITRYWILRRIEEFIDVPTDQAPAVDGSGNLSIDPAAHRPGEAAQRHAQPGG